MASCSTQKLLGVRRRQSASPHGRLKVLQPHLPVMVAVQLIKQPFPCQHRPQERTPTEAWTPHLFATNQKRTPPQCEQASNYDCMSSDFNPNSLWSPFGPVSIACRAKSVRGDSNAPSSSAY